MGFFLLYSIRGIFQRPFRFAAFLNEIKFIGAHSFVVIFFTAAFTGMVLGVQGYYTLSKFGSEGLLGSAVALTLIRELGPVLTGPHGYWQGRISHVCRAWDHENNPAG